MTGLALGLLSAVCAGVAYGAVRHFRGRSRQEGLMLGSGLVLIAASLLIGVLTLPVRDPPHAEPPAIGVIPPPGGSAAFGSGLVEASAIRVRGCANPVGMTIVVNGTADFWKHAGPAFPASADIRVAIPDAEVREVQVGMSSDARDVALPQYAIPRQSAFFRPSGVQIRDGMTIVGGTVRDWRRHLNSLVVQFEADWLEDRGLGTCFLRRPVLTGPLSVLATQRALGHASRSRTGVVGSPEGVIRSTGTGYVAAYEPKYETTLGSSIVVVTDGDVLGDSSLPSVQETTEGNPTWTCSTKPGLGSRSASRGHAVPDLLTAERTSGAAYSRGYLERSRETDCGGIAVVTTSNAGVMRDAVLLLLGALFSLGAALLVEALVSIAGSRGGRSSRPATGLQSEGGRSVMLPTTSTSTPVHAPVARAATRQVTAWRTAIDRLLRGRR